MALDFYYGSGSSFAWKVWLVLEQKQIPYDFKLLSFDKQETRAPAFLALNPRGRVPTIVHDGFALWESTAILEYLEERFPERPLLPKDVKARAMVRRLMCEADNYLAPALNELFNATLFAPEEKQDAGRIAKAQDGMVAELARWDALLTGEYLAGGLSLADFAAFPHARLVQRIDQRQPRNGIGGRMPGRVAAWIKRIEAMPYYAKTTPPHWKS
ncbi:MAG: glutathione S-transferase family protein [Dongiaceae bacterium]